MTLGPLDLIPLWLVLPLTMIVSLLALEVGYKSGIWRHSRPRRADAGQSGNHDPFTGLNAGHNSVIQVC